MSTSDNLLIDRLTSSLRPVRPLRPPGWRACVYLLWTFALLGIVVLVSGLHADLAKKMAQPGYFAEWLASLVTGLTAVISAFYVSVPGRARLWAWLPLVPLTAWLSVISAGCWNDWVRAGPDGVEIGTSFHCLRVIISLSLPLGGALLLMTRHSAAIRPNLTALHAGLGVAALSAAALTLFHPLNASIMVLIWHGLAIALVVLGGQALGPPLMSWSQRLDRRLHHRVRPS